jgi:nicotinamidase/pyrazinamidase
LPAIERLNRFAVEHGIPIVSTTCAHGENDDEFKGWPVEGWPPHCVTGTPGQLKPSSTIVGKTVVVPNHLANIDIAGAQQIILEKQRLDLFTNPNLLPLLDKLGAEHYVVYGVVTEYCVRHAVTGLLGTGKPVTLISDAVETQNPAESDAMIAEFTERGGVVRSVQNYCQSDGFPAA